MKKEKKHSNCSTVDIDSNHSSDSLCSDCNRSIGYSGAE